MGQLGNHTTRHSYNEMSRTLEGIEGDCRMILVSGVKLWDLGCGMDFFWRH